jgi:prohibitin 2
MVNVKMRVLIRPNSDKLPEIYRNLGMDYDGRVLPSVGNEVLKSVIARYSATQLLTEREQVSAKIREILKERLIEFNIELDDVSITDLSFGSEFTKAIEQKQIAQQQAERAKYQVEQALQDKRSTIIKAQGEAKAARLLGEAMKQSPAFLDLRRVEASRDIATVLSRGRNKVFLEADTLLMNLTSGLNSSLEKKSSGDIEAERLDILERRRQQQSK